MMSENKVVEWFSIGKVIFPGSDVDASKMPWYEHPEFKGVFLKDLVTGKDTRGMFSCHIVRIKKGCMAGEHSHAVQWEFNEALQGRGSMTIEGKEYSCEPGFSFVTPPGISHVVSAPGEDVYILAKFVPALM